jgi:hypothetical protein
MCSTIISILLFANLIASYSEEKEWPLDKPIDGKDRIKYNITNSNVTKIAVENETAEVHIYVNSTKDNAILEVELDRTLIDSKDVNNTNTDAPYQVYFGASGPIGATGNSSGSADEKIKNTKIRKLQIQFPVDVEQIRIKGTQFGPSIIEFELSNKIITFFIALLIISVVFYISIKLLRIGKRERLRDIICDNSWYPSLAKFQFLIWTLIITFAFLWIYSLRVSGGLFDVGGFLDSETSVPWNLLLLMGITGGAYVVNKKISEIKYKHEERPAKPHKLVTMLYEGGRKSLTRIQYFAWTWIAAIVYLVILVLKVTTANSVNLSIPDIPGVLVYLMGLGQGAYIGGKYVTLESVFTKDEAVEEPKPTDQIGNIGDKLAKTSLSAGEIKKTSEKVSEASEELAKKVSID